MKGAHAWLPTWVAPEHRLAGDPPNSPRAVLRSAELTLTTSLCCAVR